MRKITMETAIDDDDDDDFVPLCVLFVNDDVSSVTVNNLKRRLRAPITHGGCQLMVRVIRAPPIDKKGTPRTALLVACDDERLLKEAELQGIAKVGPHGDMVPFCWDHVHRDSESDDTAKAAAANMFSQSEKLRLLCQMLDRLRITADEVDAFEDVPLIYVPVPHLRQQGIVSDAFPLHDHNRLNRLAKIWYKTFAYEQPLDAIRDYFGEKIGIYFAFLSYYTKVLIICAAVAIAYRFSFTDSANAQALFATFNLILLTLFLKFWQRHCATLAYYWGTLGFVKYESPRPEFQGKLEPSSVTNRPEPVYATWRRWRTILLLSYPVVSVWLGVAVFIIWLYFWVQFRVDNIYMRYHFILGYTILYLPTVAYGIVIEILNRLYKKTAVFLTNLENHRLQSQYENHLLTKLILFQFINCFGWLFYVAFLQQDMDALRRYLACLLITMQIIQQILECTIPYLRIKCTKHIATRLGLSIFDKFVFEEEALDTYEDTFSDYLELWLQFGYVFMFSAVYPMASFWALVNNIIEIRGDAIKICRTMRRPFPHAADSIGPWQSAFDALVAISVATNCALLGLSKSFEKYFSSFTGVQRVLFVVLLEHLILLFIVAIHKLIPNLPDKLKLRLARLDFMALQALTHKRLEHITKREPFKRATTFEDVVDTAAKQVTVHRFSEL